MMRYDFFNDLFTVYEPVEYESKVLFNLPLFDEPIEMPQAVRITDDGIPVIKNNRESFNRESFIFNQPEVRGTVRQKQEIKESPNETNVVENNVGDISKEATEKITYNQDGTYSVRAKDFVGRGGYWNNEEPSVNIGLPIGEMIVNSNIDLLFKNYKKGDVEGNSKIAYKYLVQNGIPKKSAAGIVGNLYCENLANPLQTVKDAKNTIAYGIAGFNSGGWWPALRKWGKEHGYGDKPGFKEQLDFIIEIIKTNNSGLGQLLNDKLSVEQASFIWGKDFERFRGSNGKGFLNRNDPEHIKRRKTSLKIYKNFNG